jgi:RNA polymerase sigma factor (sigma-70 family)
MYEEWADELLGYCRKLVRTGGHDRHFTADDLAATAWMKASTRISQFDTPSSEYSGGKLRQWLYVIVKNKYIDWNEQYKHKRLQPLDAYTFMIPDGDDTPEEAYLRKAFTERCRSMLTDGCTPMELAILDALGTGATQQSVATMFGTTRGCVRGVISRSRHLLGLQFQEKFAAT